MTMKTMRDPIFRFPGRILPRPCGAAIPLGFALSICAQSVAALGLGDLTLESGLGQPLRAHVALIAAPDEELPAASCFRLAGEQGGADMPRLSRARLSIEKRADGPRLTIRAAQPVNEPILMVGIQVRCGLDLERDYTLLPEPVAAAPELPVAAAPAGARAPRSERPPMTTGQWMAASGETLQSIAEALYPDSPRMQRRFVRAVSRANPGLFEGKDAATMALAEGTRLNVPSLRELSVPERRTAEPDIREAAPAQVKPRPAAPAQGEPGAGTDRLRIGAVPPESARASGPAGSQDLQAREKRLMAAMEDMTAMELSMADRIVRMERAVAGLRAAIEEADRQIEAASAPQAQGAGKPAAKLPAALPAASPQSAREPASERAGDQGPRAWWLAAALGLAGVWGLLVWRRRAAAKAAQPGPEAAPVQESPTRFESVDIPITEPLPARPAAKSSPPATPVSMAREEEHVVEVAEHGSAAELAEIMLAFGQSEDAMRNLSDFVAANPQQLVGPWMKMLQVYRGAGMRKEFEALASRLHKMFNFAVVAWAGAASKAIPQQLEEYPHVIARLQEVWGRREALDYLVHLVTDNRNGTRFGFSVPVIQEILLLISLMADRQGAKPAGA